MTRLKQMPLHARPREKLSAKGAAAVIVARNHPSGGLSPSREDLKATPRQI